MRMRDKLAKLVALLVITWLAGALVSLNPHAKLDQITFTSPQASDPPRQIHLTWSQNDTSHTITIAWKTTEENSGDQVLYDTESRGGEVSLYRYSENGSHHAYEGLSGYIHDVELTDLSPDTVYYFVCGGENGGYSEERSFRTAPDISTSFTFVIGGDSQAGAPDWPWGRNAISSAMAKFNPSFVLRSGDLVSKGIDQTEWDNFFEDIDEYWVGTNGLTIPIIPALGNHEHYDYEYDVDLENALPKYLGQFALPGNEKWYSLDWGPDLHIIVLDSEEISDDEQLEWLENDLATHVSSKWKVAIFHRPPFSVADSSGDTSVRQYWVPLFDNYHVNLVFNGHHHFYQRTHPINYTKSKNEPAPAWEGTTYVVTGGWGASTHSYSSPRWWTASTRGTYHFIVVNVLEDGLNAKAVKMDGTAFDEFFIPAEAPSSSPLLIVVAAGVVALVMATLLIVRRKRAPHVSSAINFDKPTTSKLAIAAKGLACLFLVGILSLGTLPSPAAAQLENIWIMVNDFDPDKIAPGGTVDASFTFYKPSGIEVEGKLHTWMLYHQDDAHIFINKWYYLDAPETSVDISWGAEEKQQDFTLPLKILDNAPIGASVYLGAALVMNCSYSLIDVDNDNSIQEDVDNIIITIGDEDFNKVITDVREYNGSTRYYIASGRWVSPGSPPHFFVLGYGTALTLEPPSIPWLTVAPVVAGVGAAIVVGLVLVRSMQRAKRAAVKGYPTAKARRWYLYQNNKQYGPYSEADLSKYLDEGRVRKDALVWCKGMEGWKKISEVEAFQASLHKTS